MKALVVGASGRVGRHLLLRTGGVGTYASRPFDAGLHLAIEDAGEVDAVMDFVKPDVVFQPGSMTNVDACTLRPHEALRVNVEGVANLARACRAAGAFLVSFSTDYVFDGAAGPYAEDARPRPISHYGLTKLEGERAAEDAGVVVRTASVYDAWPGDGNFMMFVRDRLAAGEPVYGYTDQFGTPSFAPDVAAAAIEIAEQRRTGVVHVAGPEFLSRYEFAVRVARAFGLDPARIEAATTAQRPQATPRPPKAGLISSFRLRTFDAAMIDNGPSF